MQDMLVALDLETTGLKPEQDRIIEIGAVRIQGDSIVDEWHTLINPGMPVPQRTTEITGITNEDVQDAPRLSHVLADLQKYLTGGVLVGHNVPFDVAFLRNSGLSMDMPTIDTYAVASALLPRAPGYSLSALTQQLDIPLGDAHRALDDAIMTARLVIELEKRAHALPSETLKAIAVASQRIQWGGRYFFLKTYEAVAGTNDLPPEVDVDLDSSPFEPGLKHQRQLEPHPDQAFMDVDEVAAILEPGGAISRQHSTFEHRQQQVKMLRTVTNAFNISQHVIIEAPTGVGKSMAYLIPSIYFALLNESRVVISTNTINLQEQLLTNEIPFLKKALGASFQATLLKGRSNYLCPRRLNTLTQRGPTSALEMLVYAKTLVWLTESSSGDRGELNLRGAAENALWSRLSAENEGCTMLRCEKQMKRSCPFYKARRRAEGAHIVIVNHTLLLSDAVTEGNILPPYEHLIIDEAHHLEDAITNSMSFRIDVPTIKRQLADLGTQKTGLLGDILKNTRGAIPPAEYASLSRYVGMVVDAKENMMFYVNAYVDALVAFLRKEANVRRNSSYAQPVRVLPKHREHASWAQVRKQWDNLSSLSSGVADGMEKLADAFNDVKNTGYEIPNVSDIIVSLRASSRHMTALHDKLNNLTVKPNLNTIYWVTFPSDARHVTIHAAPLEVGPLVTQHIWNKCESAVLASATLRTNSTFDYIRDRLDAEYAEEIAIDSPFNYEENTLIYLPTDMPEPNQDGYQENVERAVQELCLATEGRALVLFTSYSQLRRTAEAISPALSKAGILVFDQGDGASRSQLLDGFVTTERSVLMGTRSFWEGVDVPGADLSALVIVRLPFSVPTDPIYASRSEQYGNPFMEYGIPETILHFRQGFGRLIRTSHDRGIVVILDRRVVTKRYGRMFLNSLPPCTTREGTIRDLPQTAVRWIDG